MQSFKSVLSNAIIATLVIGASMPASAHFLSKDPVATNANNGQNFNRYSYASNNPYSRIDPDGRRDIYIGGAGDKDGSRIVQDYAERQKKEHPDRDVQYFGWSDKKQILTAMAKPLAKGEPLNVVGHSLGGSQGIENARDTKATVTNLITIDPVAVAEHGKPSSVTTWTNITTTPATEKRNMSDAVATVGRGILGTTDTSGADVSRTSTANHGSFDTMMTEVGAAQIIDSSYQPNPQP